MSGWWVSQVPAAEGHFFSFLLPVSAKPLSALCVCPLSNVWACRVVHTPHLCCCVYSLSGQPLLSSEGL